MPLNPNQQYNRTFRSIARISVGLYNKEPVDKSPSLLFSPLPFSFPSTPTYSPCSRVFPFPSSPNPPCLLSSLHFPSPNPARMFGKICQTAACSETRRHFLPHREFAHQRTQHPIVVRPTAVRAISTDIICQTIVQHCRTFDLELTATCCVKLRLFLYFQIHTHLFSTAFCKLSLLACSASASVAA